MKSWYLLAGTMVWASTVAPAPPQTPTSNQIQLTVATFNVQELSLEKLRGTDPEGQVDAAVQLLRAVRPDIVLVNEIDAEPPGVAAQLLRKLLADPQRTLGEPLDYPFQYSGPVNTGSPSGFDLDLDGKTDGPGDAWGFGRYLGQYGMAVLSRYPIVAEDVRTFRGLLWKDLPGHLIPDGRSGRPAWYPAEVVALQPLSSKSHWDVPVRLPNGQILHLLASHPTPPVFDGEEDRNGRRNFDEIRLLAELLTADTAANAWIADDAGVRGGLAPTAHVVVLGDLNADPVRDQAPYGRTAISQLLGHSRICDPRPRGPGGAHFERPYSGDATERTNSWGRLDYVLPSCNLEVVAARVVAPAPEDPMFALAKRASDHSMVAVTLRVPAP